MSNDDFLSGTSGLVWGIRATSRAAIADFACDAAALVMLEQPRLRRAARVSPRRRVLVLAVQREDAPNILEAARDELLLSHHEVRFESSPVAGRGKFENLDVLLERVPVEGCAPEPSRLTKGTDEFMMTAHGGARQRARKRLCCPRGARLS